MAKSFEQRVKVIEVNETQEFGANNFKKRTVIGIVEGEYPEEYEFEFIKDKTEIPDDLIIGSYMNFHFNLKGKRVSRDGKPDMFFTTLQAWKVEA